jgi:hypothetical protein
MMALISIKGLKSDEAGWGEALRFSAGHCEEMAAC